MSSPTGSPWSDRRGLFQKGKELHEPGRSNSVSSTGGGMVDAIRRASVSSVEGIEKSLSNASSTSNTSTADQRRRSSNAGSSGLFNNLTQHKRGSEDYSQRRASHHEQMNTGGGFLSGWYHSTFKGVQSNPAADKAQASTQTKRGVME